jgi:hypothetical protein
MYCLLHQIDDLAVAEERADCARIRLQCTSQDTKGNNKKHCELSACLNAAILKQRNIGHCFHISLLHWANLTPCFIIEFCICAVVMTIKNVRNINLHTKELVHEAILITDWFNVDQIPKWSAILFVVENFEQATLSTGKQETELLNSICEGAWALNKVTVATQRFLASVASQPLES